MEKFLRATMDVLLEVSCSDALTLDDFEGSRQQLAEMLESECIRRWIPLAASGGSLWMLFAIPRAPPRKHNPLAFLAISRSRGVREGFDEFSYLT